MGKTNKKTKPSPSQQIVWGALMAKQRKITKKIKQYHNANWAKQHNETPFSQFVTGVTPFLSQFSAIFISKVVLINDVGITEECDVCFTSATPDWGETSCLSELVAKMHLSALNSWAALSPHLSQVYFSQPGQSDENRMREHLTT